MIGSIHNNGIRTWYVDTCFNDGSTHKYVVALVIEVAHYAFKFALAHLAVPHCNTGFRNDFSDFFGRSRNAIHFIVKEVNLTTTQYLTHNGFANNGFITLLNKSFN